MSTLVPAQAGSPVEDFESKLLDELKQNRDKAEAFLIDALRFRVAAGLSDTDLRTRSFLRRFVGKFTGANNRLRDISRGHLVKSLAATHEYIGCLVENTQFLTDSINVTQRFLSHLKLDQDSFKRQVSVLFKKTHERLSRLEANVDKHEDEIKSLGIAVTELKSQVQLQSWAIGLQASIRDKYSAPFLVKILEIVRGFISAKRRFWTQSDLNIFKTKLREANCGNFEAEIRTDVFFEEIANLTDSHIDEIRKCLTQLFDGLIDNRPFHLFSGVTWPIALLWFLVYDRERLRLLFDSRGSHSKGSLLKEEIESFYSFPGFFSEDFIVVDDFGEDLLAGLRPLTNPETVKERMLEIVDDARMEFCDLLNPTSRLLEGNGRVLTRDYSDFEDAPTAGEDATGVAGIQVRLMRTEKNDVRLHLQYVTEKDGGHWRTVLSFKGSYQHLKNSIVRQAELHGIGGLTDEQDDGFEIICKIEPAWNRWDEQRQELARMALKAREFFALAPLPPV